MPRVSRIKAKHHAPAVQLPSKRSFAATQTVETVLPGSGLPPVGSTGTGSGIFGIAPPVEAGPSKKPLFGNRAKAAGLPPLPLHPYSRSHVKREKRKAKQKLSNLGDVGAALPALEDEWEDEEVTTLADKAVEQMAQPVKRKPKDGLIGEGKGLAMKEKKKRKQIKIEGTRIPAIMQHPAYKADPWATIRLHAANTLDLKSSLTSQPAISKPAANAGLTGSGDVDM